MSRTGKKLKLGAILEISRVYLWESQLLRLQTIFMCRSRL